MRISPLCSSWGCALRESAAWIAPDVAGEEIESHGDVLVGEFAAEELVVVADGEEFADFGDEEALLCGEDDDEYGSSGKVLFHSLPGTSSRYLLPFYYPT
jgi:hypothetical protein